MSAHVPRRQRRPREEKCPFEFVKKAWMNGGAAEMPDTRNKGCS
jgi:hypothetical protein